MLFTVALLPPVNRWKRPHTPPPPPPTNSAEAKSSESHQFLSRIIEQLEKSRKGKNTVKPTTFYENAEFHRKLATGSSISTNQQQTTPRKTGTVNVARIACMNKLTMISKFVNILLKCVGIITRVTLHLLQHSLRELRTLNV